MADDNTNGQGEGGSSFGEVTEREETGAEGDKAVLVADKLKAKTEGEGTTGAAGDSVTPESGTKVEGETGAAGEATEDGDKTKLTEKGTKLDPNPQSAVHQELANERKIRANYEKVLADPKLLQQFAKTQYGIEIPAAKPAEQTTAETVKEYKGEDFESLEDVANVVNGLQKSFLEKSKSYEEEIKTLKENVSSLLQGGKQQKVTSTITSDIGGLQTLPELTKGNPEYIEGLEEDIVNEYHRLDFDEAAGTYKGEHSLAEIGKKFIEVAKKARKAGSLNAQTVVKDKSQGKVVTSPTTTEEVDTKDLTPGDAIALGISKKFGRQK